MIVFKNHLLNCHLNLICNLPININKTKEGKRLKHLVCTIKITFQVIPEQILIEAKSKIFIELLIQPNYFEVENFKKEVTNYIVGHIFLEEQYR